MFIDAKSQILSFNFKNYVLWFILSFNAGCINIGGFLAAHRFVSHITGYATHFGDEFSRGNLGRALSLASVPVFFIIGSMISAWFTDRREIRSHKDKNYAFLFFLISGILFFISVIGPFGVFGLFGAENEFLPNYFLISLLAISSGLQNAMISTASGLLVRTTHLTGISTDFGVGLIRFFNLPLGSEQRTKEMRVNLLRGGTIGSFILGSIIASFQFRRFEYLGFLLPALITGSLGYYTHYRNRKYVS
jgi:uncharacterized membrane protein YoaK (UPF0700 family)